MLTPGIERNEGYFLTSGTLKPFEISRTSLNDLLRLETVSLQIDGNIK